MKKIVFPDHIFILFCNDVLNILFKLNIIEQKTYLWYWRNIIGFQNISSFINSNSMQLVFYNNLKYNSTEALKKIVEKENCYIFRYKI